MKAGKAFFSSLFNYKNRRALSAGVAVLAAMPAGQWAMIAAFLVSQTAFGTTLRQGMVIFFLMIVSLFLSLLMHDYLNYPIYMSFIGFLIIVGAGSAALSQSVISLRPTLLSRFVLLVLIAAFSLPFVSLHDEQFLSCVIGILIGMLCTLLIAFVSLEKEFRSGLLSLLEALEGYSREMRVYMGRSEFNHSEADKLRVEKALQATVSGYPEWVFAMGFNPGLRSGFRFFLLNLDNVIASFFSLSLYLQQKLNPEIVLNIKEVFNLTTQRNTELIAILIKYFRDRTPPASDADFTQDIKDLEAAVKKIIPESLEIIDLSPDYPALSAIVRDLKDIRNMLLQLLSALPAT